MGALPCVCRERLCQRGEHASAAYSSPQWRWEACSEDRDHLHRSFKHASRSNLRCAHDTVCPFNPAHASPTLCNLAFIASYARSVLWVVTCLATTCPVTARLGREVDPGPAHDGVGDIDLRYIPLRYVVESVPWSI